MDEEKLNTSRGTIRRVEEIERAGDVALLYYRDKGYFVMTPRTREIRKHEEDVEKIEPIGPYKSAKYVRKRGYFEREKKLVEEKSSSEITECPECKSPVTDVELTEDYDYRISCPNCETFKAGVLEDFFSATTALEEKKIKCRKTEELKEWAKRSPMGEGLRCRKCGKQFVSKRALRDHIGRVHGGELE